MTTGRCRLAESARDVAILSIQSHVAAGYVGNAAAVFTLQRLGYEVWPLPTVLYSNHPGHGSFAGETVRAALLRSLLRGLQRHHAWRRCTTVLSGYLAEAELGAVVAEAVKVVKAETPDALFLLDPVLGDSGTGLFVNPEVAAVTRDRLLAVADIVTPNEFELGWLTGTTAADETHLIALARGLLSRGPTLALVTGIERGAYVDTLLVAVGHAWRLRLPVLGNGERVNGAGDFFAALFLGHYLRDREPVQALESAGAAVHTALTATLAAGLDDVDVVGTQAAWTNASKLSHALRIQ